MQSVAAQVADDLRPEDLQDVFPFLTIAEIGMVLPYMETREWQSGETLMRDGEPGDFMGVLLSGKLAVKKETTFPGKYILVAVLERGSMVGEISAVECGKRNATVTATSPCRLLVLNSANLDRLLADNSMLGVKLLKRIIHVLGSRLRKASDRLSMLL